MTSDASRGAEAPPELVQLLTPEGERDRAPRLRHRPDHGRDARAVPRPGPGPPGRPRGRRTAAAGRARHLGLAARPGGRPDRLGPRPDRRRHGLPDLPRARRRLVPRRRPGQAARALPRRQPRRLGSRRSTTSTSTRSSSAARPCTPSATPWASSATAREDGEAPSSTSATAPPPGRRQRGVHLGLGLQRARRVLLPEQPVGDLRAAGAADRIPLYQRASGFGFPGIRVDGNDVLRLPRRHPPGHAGRPRGAGPDADRGVHLPDGRAHHLRRPDPLPAGRRAGGVEAQGPDRAGEGVPGPAPAWRTRSSSTPSTPRPTSSARGVRQALPGDARSRPLAIFDNVYAEPHAADSRPSASEFARLPAILRRAGGGGPMTDR